MSGRFAISSFPDAFRGLALAVAAGLLLQSPATAQSSPEAYVTAEWQRFMTECGPLLLINEQSFFALEQRQSAAAGKTADGKMIAFASGGEAAGFNYTISSGSNWYAVECETFRFIGIPFSADVIAETLSSLVNASEGMELVGGETLGAEAGIMFVPGTYNFTIWGAFPQPEMALIMEISDEGHNFHVAATVSKTQ